MSFKTLFGIIVIVAIISGASWYVWQANQQTRRASQATEGQISVGATIFPLANLVQQVGGEHVHVTLLIPPGISEHSAALTPQQLQSMASDKILFQIGNGLDTKLTQRVQAAFPTIQVVTVDRGIQLRTFAPTSQVDDEETGVDPHYWLTVPNGLQIAMTIRDELQKADPTHTADYQRNFDRLAGDLQSLETEFQATAQAMPRKQFIAMHNAWSYLADHYGLELVDTYEPIEGHDPSVQDLQRLKDLVTKYNITTFYAEPQKASSSATNLLHQELGLDIRILDPVGGLGERTSYQALLRYNWQQLAAGAQ